MRLFLGWLPAGLMSLGAVFTVGIETQRPLPLRAPLASAIPVEIDGYVGQDIEISEQEQRVAGMTEYVLRVYERADPGPAAAGFSLYVGYYDQQSQGKTIHSPKNCLPGAGWEMLTSRTAVIATSEGPVTVNRFLLQKGERKALVLYWYQGRGRVQANEYIVKWDLLRDSALRGRSDEALVRIVVPITESEEDAFEIAANVAQRIVPAVYRSLPS
jgi:EpsI family protein